MASVRVFVGGSIAPRRGGDFEGVVGAAGVAAGVGGDLAKGVVVGLEVEVAEAAIGVGEGALQELDDLIFGELLEDVDAAAGEESAVDFEGWIFGGGADEADAAFFDVRKKGILLGFVEAVNFVDEDDGAGAVLAGAVGVGHDLLDFLDAGEDGGELDELGFGDAGDDFGERGFAGAGRAPEDHGGGIVALDLNTQGLAGADKMFLADELFEGARAHAVGERTSAGGGLVVRSGWGRRDSLANL